MTETYIITIFRYFLKQFLRYCFIWNFSCLRKRLYHLRIFHFLCKAMQRNFNQMHEFCIPRGTVLTFLGVIAGSKSLRPMWNFFRILCTKNYSERLIFDWFIPVIIGGSFWDSIGLFAHKLWSTVVWSIDTIAWNWNCSLRTVFRTCSFGWFLRASASPTTDVLPTLSCGLQTQTAEANLPESSRLYSWRYALVVSVLLVLLHITPVLRQLHWLPVRQRIHYKLASLAFRALSGLAPDYLAGDCQLVGDSGLRSLRSAERRVCSVPRQNSTFGDRSFAAAGPRAGWAACMEWAAVQSMRHCSIVDCLQCTFEDPFIFHLVWCHGAFVTFMISLCRI